MAETITGFVARVFEKSGTNANGPWTAYSCKIQDPETGKEFPKFYQFGFEAPPAGVVEGAYIRFQANPKNAQADEVVRETVQISSNPPTRPAAPQQNNGGGGRRGGGNRGGMSKEREEQIVFQHSQEMAIQAVTTLLANDGLKISKAKNAGGDAKRFEEITAQIDKFTVKFFLDARTPSRLLDTVDDWSVTDVEANGDLPADTTAPAEEQGDFQDDDPAFGDQGGDDDPAFT